MSLTISKSSIFHFLWIATLLFGELGADSDEGKLIFRSLEHQPRIYQGAPAGVHVTTVHAYNPDSPRNKVLYNLASVLDRDYFVLDKTTGNLTTAKIIDKSVGESYKIIVSAVSGDLSQIDHLYVAVTQFNEFSPQFEKQTYEVELSTQADVDTHVLQVHAVDADTAPPNAEVYYKMDQNLSTNFFNLNSTTGELTVARPLNTTEHILVFGIFAEDGGSPRRWAKAQVKIAIKSISVPLEITVSNITTSTATICWMPPEIGFVTGYILNYRSNKMDKYLSEDVNSGHFSTCTTLTQLSHGVDYEFQLIAVNPDETGQPTTWQKFQTKRNRCENVDCKAGECVSIDEPPYYECECHEGFYGQQCGFFNKCVENPCGNGTCYNMTNDEHYCICPDGSRSLNCSMPCFSEDNVCHNGGTCQGTSDENYECLCAGEFYGRHCEYNNPCYLEPCKRSGTCTIISNNSFSCICLPGRTGKYCEEVVNACDSSPCKNGGQCVNYIDSFTCICSPGFEGYDCTMPLQCPSDETDTIEGTLFWNETDHSFLAKTQCPFEVSDSNQSVEFATRMCMLSENETAAWGPVNTTACQRQKLMIVEQISGDLRSFINDPSAVDGKQLEVAAKKISSISSYAAKDKKVAEDMVATISNVLNADNNVINEDENGTISENFVQFVDDLAENVPLKRGENSTVETENIKIVAVQWHPEIADNSSDQSIALKFDIFTQKQTTVDTVSFTNETLSTSVPFLNMTLDEKVRDQEDAVMQVYIPFQALEEAHQQIQSDVRVKCVMFSNDKLFQTKKNTTNDDTDNFSPTSDQDTIISEENVDDNSMTVPVLQISVSNCSLTNLSKPLVYIFTMSTKRKANCVFWKEKKREWATDGIITNQTDKLVICESSHMTAFSVLFDPTPQIVLPSIHAEALSLISNIGCGLSVIGLSLTILTYSIFRSLNRDHQGKILINLTTSLLFLNFTFLMASLRKSKKDDIPCVVITMLLHYFVLTSLSWMLVEAVNMYQLLIQVFATAERHFMLKRCILAWLTPMLVVLIPVLSSFREYNYHDNGCVISPRNPWIYYASFFTPCLLILITNTAVFIMVARVLFQPRFDTKVTESMYPTRQVTIAQFRGAITVMVLLGVTWVIGTFAIGDVKIPFQYVFCILNSGQGFLIFLVRCLMYPEARLTWMELVKHGKFKKHRGGNVTGGLSWSTNSNSIRQQTSNSASYKTSTPENESVTFHGAFWNRKKGKEAAQTPDVNTSNIVKNVIASKQNQQRNVTKNLLNARKEISNTLEAPALASSTLKSHSLMLGKDKKENLNNGSKMGLKDINISLDNSGYKSPKSEPPISKTGKSPAIGNPKKFKDRFSPKERRMLSPAVTSNLTPIRCISCPENDNGISNQGFHSGERCFKTGSNVSMPNCSIIASQLNIDRKMKSQKKHLSKLSGMRRLNPGGVGCTSPTPMAKENDGQSDVSSTIDIDDSPSSSPNTYRSNIFMPTNICSDRSCQGPKF